MKSYSSESSGVLAFFRDLTSLYRLHSRDLSERVRGSIADARGVEARVYERTGVRLRDLDILEIGPGQFLSQLTYFAIHNRVLGIDRDVVVRGYKPLGYLEMLWRNGFRRTLKTIGRKLMGVDRRYASHLIRQLELTRTPVMIVRSMDVCKMRLPDSSFDFVYSRSVLHSLRDPGSALDEIVRVVRPGGVAYISIHPFTSATGCLDPRIYTDRSHEVKGWPHLRPQLQNTLLEPNVYLNKLRIKDWQTLFESKMSGTEYIITPSSDPGILDEAERIQGQGECLDYSLEELTAGEVVMLWKKPTAPKRIA